MRTAKTKEDMARPTYTWDGAQRCARVRANVPACNDEAAQYGWGRQGGPGRFVGREGGLGVKGSKVVHGKMRMAGDTVRLAAAGP